MPARIRILLFAVLLSLAPCVMAALPETPRLRQITTADGLPSDDIHGLAQDRYGYLWIATADGLARYNGLTFQVWRREQGMPHNNVRDVLVDDENRVWAATEAGLAVLDEARGDAVALAGRRIRGLPEGRINALERTPDGSLWLATGEGLYRVRNDRSTRMPARPGVPGELPSSSIYSLAKAVDGTLWVVSRGGVSRWTGRDFETLAPTAVREAYVYAATPRSDGSLWIGTDDGVLVRRPDGRFEPAPFSSRDMQPPTNLFSVLLHDRAGNVWLDAQAGLAMWDGKRGGAVPTYSQVLQGPAVPTWADALEDRGGGLWFASIGQGLWYLPPDWSQFAVLVRRKDDPTTLGNIDITAMAAGADGGIWLTGSSGSLDRLDPETGIVARRHYDAAASYVPSALMVDGQGAVWFAYFGGLARFRPGDGSIRHWTDVDGADAPLPRHHIGLLRDGEDQIWMATALHGVQLRAADGHVLDTILPGAGRGLDDMELHWIGRAPDGGVWVAGSSGVVAWNAGTRRFEPVAGSPAERITGVAVGGDGRVWLLREGKLGIYGWDGARLHPAVTIGAADGLPQIRFEGLTIDRDGRAWVTTHRGLVRVDPQRRSVQIYGTGQGLPVQKLLGRPLANPADGRILIALSGALAIFDPAKLGIAPATADLVFEQVQVRRGQSIRELPDDTPFKLEAGDRDLRVVARLLDFNDARHHRYRFRLVGHDADWVDVGATGERVFSLLEPGHYRLEVIARTAQSLWSEPLALEFEVVPPWWRTWWAQALGLVVLLLAVAAAMRLWQRRERQRMDWERIRHENEVAREASLAKTRFLATLGHEVRTPMTGVLGMSELLLGSELDGQQRSRVEAIRRAGEHLLRLVNDALDLARIEAGRLELESDAFSLRALMQDVTGLMAPMAERRGLRFDHAIAPGTPAALSGDRTRVAQVLMNLLGNAIKFTERGFVAIEAQPLPDGGVRFVVSDSGPGLNEEQQQRLFRRFEQAEGARTAARYGGSGLGLAISQELAAAMGGRIDVRSAPGKGTRFIVDLPLPVAAERDSAAVADAPRAARALRLLLVEDDPTVAQVLTGLLQAQGHTVAHAPHGLAALSEAAMRHFDLGLLDLDLPGIDGLELARQLRAQGFAAPLVAVTARADADAEPLARDAGFDGFLRKPLTGAMLAEAIGAAVPDAAAS